PCRAPRAAAFGEEGERGEIGPRCALSRLGGTDGVTFTARTAIRAESPRLRARRAPGANGSPPSRKFRRVGTPSPADLHHPAMRRVVCVHGLAVVGPLPG